MTRCRGSASSYFDHPPIGPLFQWSRRLDRTACLEPPMRQQWMARLIEAAYMVNQSEAAWLAGIARAAARLAGDSPGILVRYIEEKNGAFVGTHAAISLSPNYLQALGRMEEVALRGECNRATTLLSATGAFRTSELASQLGSAACSKRLLTRRRRESDALHVVGCEPGGKALCLHIGLTSSEVTSPAGGTRRVWTRVAMHLAAAARLRRTVNPIAAADGPPVAEHSRRASSSLREAAEAAGSEPTMRAAPQLDRSSDPWRSLVDGHWSVMDAFDSGGRRIIMLCPNPPELVEGCRLTRRERQVIAQTARGGSETKIAITLGVSISTVRTHLARAIAKLRIARVSDLMVLVAAMRREQAIEEKRETMSP